MLPTELTKLFESQRLLDQEISHKHEVSYKDVKNELMLAFIVEVGECANETRCFKYWSLKKPSEKPVILEEYVDGIHFLLSIGLHFGFNDVSQLVLRTEADKAFELTEGFHQVMQQAVLLKEKPSASLYYNLFEYYFALGRLLSFSDEDIIKAYYAKHEENYRRQESGY